MDNADSAIYRKERLPYRNTVVQASPVLAIRTFAHYALAGIAVLVHGIRKLWQEDDILSTCRFSVDKCL